ncbi:MAG: ABC transporter ATP-binding protein [Phycisphaeraceae bacterium]|nr:ABC transporter ATP-binding protein [Phycisphaerales bacterium]MCB9841960.1 ABC transporter ATP-binding protein [Phycisphaeraceae bacterium]
MSTRITIDRLSKHYPSIAGRGTTKAVDAISLTIEPGQLFFLLGPSGCGKTTLLRMIAGFIEPTGGSIKFNDRDVTRLAPDKRNTGMVFQSYALWPHMTVAQNVDFGLSVRKIAKDQRKQRVDEALKSVRMLEYADRKPMQLSGGQQQRVALARALVVRPEVLLLDEPLSNLDAKLRLEMRSEIRRICTETGITTIYVTHDQKEALSMADSIAVLDMGVIAQVGGPRALYDRPASRFVADFLGETNFLSAEVSSRTGDTITLSTAAGELQSTAFDAEATPERGNVTCSIRPEAWAFSVGEAPMSGADNISHGLKGVVAESIYLGEMAQHIVELPGETRVRVFELHPTKQIPAGSPISLMVKPDDVVVLRD